MRITTAPESRADDLRRRQHRYLFSMTLRVICFVLAILTHGWVRYLMITMAVLLPYVAVVMANSMAPRAEGNGLRPHHQHRELG